MLNFNLDEIDKNFSECKNKVLLGIKESELGDKEKGIISNIYQMDIYFSDLAREYLALETRLKMREMSSFSASMLK